MSTTIAVNAAGCGSAMKEYGHLLRNDPAWAERARAFASKVRDVTEILAACDPPRAPRRELKLKVAYHDACHLAHAQGVRREPRKVLASIPGVSVVPIEESEICCGSAGIFNLVQPEMAAQLGRRKADHIATIVTRRRRHVEPWMYSADSRRRRAGRTHLPRHAHRGIAGSCA